MAFDYKTLQATISERPPASDGYCPECGQSLTPASAAPGDKHASGPLWSWALIAVGIYVVVAALLRAWNDDHLVVVTRAPLSDTRLAVLEARSGRSAQQVLAATPGELNRALVVGAGGVVLIFIGLGAGVRRRLCRGHSAPTGVSRALLGLWGSGETLVVSAISLVLLTLSYLVVAELVVGEPPSLALIERAASRTFDVILLIVTVVHGGYVRL